MVAAAGATRVRRCQSSVSCSDSPAARPPRHRRGPDSRPPPGRLRSAPPPADAADSDTDDEDDGARQGSAARPAAKQAPASWVALFRGAPAEAPSAPPASQAGGPAPKLWEQVWPCKVLGVKGLAALPPDEPVVVAVRSADGWQEAELRACSRQAGTSVVRVGGPPDGPGEPGQVMVHSSKGPVLAAARCARFGVAPPEVAESKVDPSLDDGAAEEVALGALRLTVVKEFCSAELFAAAKAQPHLLATLLLFAEARGRVLRTKAIAVYDGDITCLLVVREGEASSILHATLAAGVIVSVHRSKSARVGEAGPGWLPRPPDASLDEYWRLAVDAAAAARGTIAYRPGGRSCLGVHGAVARETVLPPRWALTGAPKHWLRSDAAAWIEARGFTLVSAVSQRSAAAWSLRGWPPARADGAKVLSFSSGIVLAPDARGKAKTQKPLATAKPSFGSREVVPKAGPVAPAPSTCAVAVPSSSSAGPMAQGARAQAPSQAKRVVEAEAAPAGAAGAQNAPAAELGLNPTMPWRELFEVRDCGGEGDCAFVSIACSLAEAAGRRSQAKDLRPGGRSQTELRVNAAKEIRAHPGRYDAALPNPEAFAANLVRSGVYLCARAEGVGVVCPPPKQEAFEHHVVGAGGHALSMVPAQGAR